MLNVLSAVKFKGIIIDLVVVFIILAFVGLGRKKGAKLMIINLLYSLGTLVLALLLCSQFIKLLDGWFNLIEKTNKFIAGILNKIFSKSIMNLSIDEAKTASNVGIAGAQIIDLALKIIKDLIVDNSMTISEVVTPYISYYVLLFSSFIVLYILFKLVFFIIKKKLELGNLVDYNPHSINSSIGALFGLAYGAFIIYWIFYIISFLPANWIASVKTMIDCSLFSKYILKYNLIRYLIQLIGGRNFILNYIKNKIILT